MKNSVVLLIMFIAYVLLYSCSEEQDVTNNSKSIYYINESDFWEPTNGPYDNYVENIWINDNDQVYISCGPNSNYSSYILKSTDEGKTWANITAIFGDTLEGVEYNRWHHIIGTYRNRNKFVMSTDDGKTWVQIADSIPGTTRMDIVKVDSKGIVYASCSNQTVESLYRSSDKGKTWEMIKDVTDPDLHPVNLVVDDNGVIYYLLKDYYDKGYFFCSRNHGDSWNEKSYPEVIYDLYIDRENKLYRKGSHVSSDMGDTWLRLGTNGLYNDYMYGFYISPKGYYYKYSMDKIFRSKDKGNRWSMILEAMDIIKIAINSRGYLFAVMKNGMINKTKNPIE